MATLKVDKIIVINKKEGYSDSIKKELELVCTNQYLTELVEFRDKNGDFYDSTRFEHLWEYIMRASDSMASGIELLLMGNQYFGGGYFMKFNIIESSDDIVVTVSYQTK